MAPRRAGEYGPRARSGIERDGRVYGSPSESAPGQHHDPDDPHSQGYAAGEHNGYSGTASTYGSDRGDYLADTSAPRDPIVERYYAESDERASHSSSTYDAAGAHGYARRDEPQTPRQRSYQRYEAERRDYRASGGARGPDDEYAGYRRQDEPVYDGSGGARVSYVDSQHPFDEYSGRAAYRSRHTEYVDDVAGGRARYAGHDTSVEANGEEAGYGTAAGTSHGAEYDGVSGVEDPYERAPHGEPMEDGDDYDGRYLQRSAPVTDEPDDGDLVFGTFRDENEEPRAGTRVARHRRRRQRGRDKRRSLVALAVVAVVFAVLATGGVFGYQKVRDFFSAPDYSGSGSGAVEITVSDGDSASDVAKELVDKNVVKSAEAFVDAANEDSRSRDLQPGTYQLRKQMRAAAALRLLLNPASHIDNAVTIPEGLSSQQVLQRVSDKTNLPVDELEKAAGDPKALGAPSWAGNNVEGFLYPGTYRFKPKSSAKTILSAMVARASQAFEQLNFANHAYERGMEPYQVLIVASLVEGEGVTGDFKKIAQVVYNRLGKDMRLDFDSTTQYWLEKTGQGRKKHLTDKELQNPNNNYSTTLNKGLPPTAIANPGEAAIEAAMSPESGPWLYFVVTDPDGHSSFTDNMDEQDQNIQICKEKNLGC